MNQECFHVSMLIEILRVSKGGRKIRESGRKYKRNGAKKKEMIYCDNFLN